MRTSLAHTLSILTIFAGAALTACAASGDRTGFEQEQQNPTSEGNPTGGQDPGFGKEEPPPAEAPAEVAEVFGHSASKLYRLDPLTKAVKEVGAFQGCEPVTDIALDEASNLFATADHALYKVDRTTAKCTEIANESNGVTYPNSLSFVPKGTVDQNEEALVGYDGGDYVRIDLKSGGKSKIGSLGGNLISSGDIVSVKGGSTYLTVKGGSCNTNDCLVEVNPATGKMIKNWGSIEHKKVFGLSFWGGKLYGFDDAGNLFEVTFGTSQLATTRISIPAKPADLSFWGAGSTTSAPLVVTPK